MELTAFLGQAQPRLPRSISRTPSEASRSATRRESVALERPLIRLALPNPPCRATRLKSLRSSRSMMCFKYDPMCLDYRVCAAKLQQSTLNLSFKHSLYFAETEVQMSTIWDPITVGRISLSHRLALSPLTRSRALPDGTPGPYAAEYYAQRASLGLLISEGTQPSADGRAFPTRRASIPTITSPVGRRSPGTFMTRAAICSSS